MDANDTLRQIIREEFHKAIKEQTLNWWHKPAEAETDAHLRPAEVHEKKEPGKPRPAIGKGKSGKYTSAGTIPNVVGRKMKSSQVREREKEGAKMLNTFRRGGAEGAKFRDTINNQLKSKGLPTTRKHQYSQIWALASAVALKGKGQSKGGTKSKKSTEEK